VDEISELIRAESTNVINSIGRNNMIRQTIPRGDNPVSKVEFP